MHSIKKIRKNSHRQKASSLLTKVMNKSCDFDSIIKERIATKSNPIETQKVTAKKRLLKTLELERTIKIRKNPSKNLTFLLL